ncbi:response regulator transcription factor [Breznakiella homolactica]|uniref:Response regulator transcription factor n=1 Tax=Breznakiella homolactica TaxID=2798577 RepID=A0A7T7XM55_9SPIR|nr:response regulator transcription factor [Breznakiella homolactica]QQO08802.1 response regulator transcription factor [Breznakiella homolactica]
MRILIAEDQQDLNEVLSKRFKAENYSVDSCTDGEAALYYLESAEYDAAVLDIMMPKLDGLEVLRRIREQRNTTPVLLLTARDSVDDRVTGLDSGADDYLIKPFAFEELLARLRALTRKTAGKRTNIFTLADLTVDCGTHTVERSGRAIDLSGKEFAMLEYLIRNAGIVLSRDSIEQHVWSYDYEGGSNIVDVYIRYLRRKVDEPFGKKLIHTIKNAGYVLRE